jgi:hypothetical protein
MRYSRSADLKVTCCVYSGDEPPLKRYSETGEVAVPPEIEVAQVMFCRDASGCGDSISDVAGAAGASEMVAVAH